MTPATPAAACVWPRLDFTDPSSSGAARRPALAVGGQQRLRLDRVAQRASRCRGPRPRPRPPALSPRWPAPARITRCWDGPFGAVSPLDAPSWFTALPGHHREHPVPVPARVGQPLHHQHADTLAPAGAVGGLGVRLAPAVGGQAPLPGELDERAGGGHHRDPAGQRQVALARAQRLAGQMQGDQRGRARGVDGDRGALQAQGVGHPAGQDRPGAAGAEETLDLLRRLAARPHRGPVLVIHQAGEDARSGCRAGWPGRSRRPPAHPRTPRAAAAAAGPSPAPRAG